MKVKTPERNNHSWSGIKDEPQQWSKQSSAIISLVNNQYSCLVELLGVLTAMLAQEVGKKEAVTAYQLWL